MIAGPAANQPNRLCTPPGVGPRCRRLGSQIGVTRWEVRSLQSTVKGRERKIITGSFEWAGPIQLPEEECE